MTAEAGEKENIIFLLRASTQITTIRNIIQMYIAFCNYINFDIFICVFQEWREEGGGEGEALPSPGVVRSSSGGDSRLPIQSLPQDGASPRKDKII